MKTSSFGAIAAVLVALAVVSGAFGAHALQSRFDAYAMRIWEKAVFYHLTHAIGLLCVSVLPRLDLLSEAQAARVSWLLIAGILFFSGSLYALALSGVATLGAVTPIGGVAMIAGWTLLAAGLFRSGR